MRLSLKSDTLEDGLLFSVVSDTQKSNSRLLASRPDDFDHLISIAAHRSANKDRSYFTNWSFRLGIIINIIIYIVTRVRV